MRLLNQDSPPDNEEAWLFRVVTNLSLDKLREQKRRRESYFGPWLPEPLPTEGPDEIAELAENLSLGLVFMLERLSPAERAVFVLREGFDLGFDDIARLVDATSAGCRQRYRRARAHLAGQGRLRGADVEIEKQMLEKLLAAIGAGDFEALVSLFAEDCVVYADGGGVVSAAIRPVTDPRRVATVTMHLARKMTAEGTLEFHWAELNGSVGLLITLDGDLISTLQVAASDDAINRLYIVRNPEKLAHLSGRLE